MNPNYNISGNYKTSNGKPYDSVKYRQAYNYDPYPCKYKLFYFYKRKIE